MEKKVYKEVFVMKEKDDRTYFTKVGVGFYNKDGSMNLYLDALPMDGKLQLRDPKPKEVQVPHSFDFPQLSAEAA